MQVVNEIRTRATAYRAVSYAPKSLQAFATFGAALILLGAAGFAKGQSATAGTLDTTPPKSYVDATTGNLVTRISDQPGTKSLYFNRQAYTSDGLDMIYTGPDGLYALDLRSLTTRQIANGKVTDVVLAPKTRRVFFRRGYERSVYVVDIDTKVQSVVAALPTGAVLASINADETLLSGTLLEGLAHEYRYYETLALNQVTAEMRAAREKSNADPYAGE